MKARESLPAAAAVLLVIKVAPAKRTRQRKVLAHGDVFAPAQPSLLIFILESSSRRK
jgi:hypothetical protein